jgi:hypothetical protein
MLVAKRSGYIDVENLQVRSRARIATCSKILICVKALASIWLQDKIKHLILKLNKIYLI